MRSVPILSDSYYHVFNRGNQKQTLFHDRSDYGRFLFLLLYFQSPHSVSNIHRHVQYFLKTGSYKVSSKDEEAILHDRVVAVVNFCLMPNHFHLTVHNHTDAGLSQYMHKVGNAYAKYFNTKYDQTGHVFQGAYKVKLVETDKQLVYLSAYIHKNPTELSAWNRKIAQYPWSSYQDYKKNRWGDFLATNIITETFDTFAEYQSYVDSSGAKDPD